MIRFLSHKVAGKNQNFMGIKNVDWVPFLFPSFSVLVDYTQAISYGKWLFTNSLRSQSLQIIHEFYVFNFFLLLWYSKIRRHKNRKHLLFSKIGSWKCIKENQNCEARISEVVNFNQWSKFWRFFFTFMS